MRNKIPAILVSVFLFLFLAIPVNAQVVKKAETITVQKDETVNQDFFAWGEASNILGIVQGDAYIFGGKVYVEGNIKGDLVVAGGNVNVRGHIEHDLRVAGGQVTVSGQIDGNVFALGGNVEIADSAKIGGSLAGAGGAYSVFAPITKGLTVAAGDLTLGSTVEGNAQTAGGKITLTPKAQIKGDFSYLSREDAQIQSGAKVEGKTTHSLPKEARRTKEIAKGAKFASIITSIITTLILGFIIFKFVPNFAQKTTNRVAANPGKSFLIGTITLILVPITVILLTITIVGIPIAVLTIAWFVTELIIAKIFVLSAIGKRLMAATKTDAKLFACLLAGLLLYIIITQIPIIGPIVTFLVLTTGLGAIISTRFKTYKEIRSKNLV